MRKVTAIDISRAFGSEQPQEARRQRRQAQHRLSLLAQFKTHWANHVGSVCECPSNGQIFKWLKICRWDIGLLLASIEDLRSRAKHGMDPHDPYRHCLNHVSAALIRRVRGKYGEMEKAA